ncbi:group 3 secretory phospholipase A2 isoform X1 [Podarcis raffonei]|uniref:group 3 secretory phospholipase A2 isoform X1 n=1 Tax=Podarcis raffonei TaxID=65483 RepID=UPI0023297E87|nr:group 3 secretory phospholipase A2 isoform X1 [Podarcis raffonei]
MTSLRPLLASLLALALTLPPGALGSWNKANTFCHTVAPDGDGRSRFLSFMWRRPDGLPPALVQSAWDSRGRLQGCAWRTEPSLISRYAELCAPPPPTGPGSRRRSGVPGTPHGSPLIRSYWGPELQRRLAALDAQKDSCRAPPGEAGAGRRGFLEDRGHKRVRRGWTMPGTLWCGAGDSAGNFTELGVFQGPDVCCREHDMCEAQISALGYKFGMRNFRLHTISHCECDERFKQCLLDQNDTISNLVGISFFNLLEIPCFVLENSEQCLEWHWWGGCKEYGLKPLARLVEQSQYHAALPYVESSSPATPPPPPRRHWGRGRKHGGKKNRKHRKHPEQDASESLRPHLEHPGASGSVTRPILTSKPDRIAHFPVRTSPGAVSVNKARVPLPPTLRTTSKPDLFRSGGVHTTAHSDVQQTGVIATRLPNEAGQEAGSSSNASKHNRTRKPGKLARSRSCSCYRRLDQCPYRIGPNEVKYQLHNVDSRTLFHCNCTRRLARFLRRTKGPNEVEEEVLSGYVSSSCFVLQRPPGCMEGEGKQSNCIDVGRAVLAPARHLTNRLARTHGGSRLKVKRQEWAPPSQPLRLFDKCMQLL